MLTAARRAVTLVAVLALACFALDQGESAAADRCNSSGCWRTIVTYDAFGTLRTKVIFVPKAQPDKVTPGRTRATRTNSERHCVSAADRRRVDCTGDPRGRWSKAGQCFLRRPQVLPPKTDPVWKGHKDGTVMICTPYGYSFTGWRRAREVTQLIWVPPVFPPTVQI